MIRRFFSLLPGIILLTGLSGCVSVQEKYDDYYVESFWHEGAMSFIEHPCPLVKYPTYVGIAPGIVTLVPIYEMGCAAASMPGVCDKQANRIFSVAESCFIPSLLLMDAGANLVGAPCWVLFGWWWPYDYREISEEEWQRIEKKANKGTPEPTHTE